MVSVFSVVVYVLWLEPALSSAARTFRQVAKTVTLLGRFRSRAQRRYVSFGQCFVEPVVRTSTQGNRYWSILEEENSQFLDEVGYYGKRTRGSMMLKPDSNAAVPAIKRSGWAAIKAAKVTKSPCLEMRMDVPKLSDAKSPTLPVSGATNDQKSPSLRSRSPKPSVVSLSRSPRPSDVALSLSPRPSDVGLSQDSAVSEKISQSIPSRFRSRRSSSLFTQQPVIRPVAESGADLNFPTIPTIEINNNESDGPLKRHTDRSGFEWYRSSTFSSSTSTEDMTSPPLPTDDYFHRLEEIRAARRASVPDLDCDRLFVRVSSDAASTVSSQTLVEGNGSFETTGAEFTDALKITDAHAERIRLRMLPEELRLEQDPFDTDKVSKTCSN